MKLNFRQKQARSYLSNKHLKINAYTFQSSANCLSYKFKAHNWLQIFILGQILTLAIRWGTLGSHWVHWSRTKGLPNWWQLIASSGHKNRELECKPTVDVPPTLHVARFKKCLRGWVRLISSHLSSKNLWMSSNLSSNARWRPSPLIFCHRGLNDLVFRCILMSWTRFWRENIWQMSTDFSGVM